jgi:hypothetical protein
MLRELEDMDKVTLTILEHLLAPKKKVDRAYNKHPKKKVDRAYNKHTQ